MVEASLVVAVRTSRDWHGLFSSHSVLFLKGEVWAWSSGDCMTLSPVDSISVGTLTRHPELRWLTQACVAYVCDCAASRYFKRSCTSWRRCVVLRKQLRDFSWYRGLRSRVSFSWEARSSFSTTGWMSSAYWVPFKFERDKYARVARSFWNESPQDRID